MDRMLEPLVMGIDVGNTKTLAVVADRSGRVLGYGRNAKANIYAHVERALSVLLQVQRQALAGLEGVSIAHLALSATGADWPEDFAALRRALQATSGADDITVVNDAVAAIWTGSPTGEGVAVALGTSAGTGARQGERVWHSSFWQEPEGAVQLGQLALRAIYRAELGLTPPTGLTNVFLKHFALPSVEALLHAFTSRAAPLGEAEAGGAARLLLGEAERGDEVACNLVRQHAQALGDYAVVAARKVGLDKTFPLVLTGGVMRHSGSLLKDELTGRVRRDLPGATYQKSDFEPVGGALCIALDALGCHTPTARETLQMTLPHATFYTT